MNNQGRMQPGNMNPNQMNTPNRMQPGNMNNQSMNSSQMPLNRGY